MPVHMHAHSVCFCAVYRRLRMLATTEPPTSPDIPASCMWGGDSPCVGCMQAVLLHELPAEQSSRAPAHVLASTGALVWTMRPAAEYGHCAGMDLAGFPALELWVRRCLARPGTCPAASIVQQTRRAIPGVEGNLGFPALESLTRRCLARPCTHLAPPPPPRNTGCCSHVYC